MAYGIVTGSWRRDDRKSGRRDSSSSASKESGADRESILDLTDFLPDWIGISVLGVVGALVLLRRKKRRA
jgi:hypothetical protein